jgi:hypothetical protein
LKTSPVEAGLNFNLQDSGKPRGKAGSIETMVGGVAVFDFQQTTIKPRPTSLLRQWSIAASLEKQARPFYNRLYGNNKGTGRSQLM